MGLGCEVMRWWVRGRVCDVMRAYGLVSGLWSCDSCGCGGGDTARAGMHYKEDNKAPTRTFFSMAMKRPLQS